MDPHGVFAMSLRILAAPVVRRVLSGLEDVRLLMRSIQPPAEAWGAYFFTQMPVP